MSASVVCRLGGLPALAGARRSLAMAPRTPRSEFLGYLKSKSAWLTDVDKHPVCLGVPIGVSGGGANSKTVNVDVGLKFQAVISLRELASCSPHVKSALFEHALQPGAAGLPDVDAIICGAPPLPMAVIIKEDMQSLPIASPLHPDALLRSVPREDLDVLLDPFFQRQNDERERKWDARSFGNTPTG